MSGGRPALLISNPAAHGFDEKRLGRVSDVLAGAFRLEHAETKAPGHAAELAADAAAGGAEAVLVLGGDGTLNEAANGLAGTGLPLGILPGGEANVLARALGVPRNPTEAAVRLVERSGAPPRRLPLGRIGDRYFTSNCGLGFDAAIVREVEANQRAKDRLGEWYFVWAGIRLFFGAYERHEPRVTLSWGEELGEREDRLHLAIVQNVSPYTYLGPRGVRLCPDTRLEAGLDCLALRTMDTREVLSVLGSAFGGARHVRRPSVRYLRDERRLRITSTVPMPAQADGEYLGERTRIDVESVPEALVLL